MLALDLALNFYFGVELKNPMLLFGIENTLGPAGRPAGWLAGWLARRLTTFGDNYFSLLNYWRQLLSSTDDQSNLLVTTTSGNNFWEPSLIGIVIGIVILLLLYRLMVVGKILIFENLGVGTLPTPPN